MGQAPLNREEQIEFMKSTRKRRDAAVERWSNSEMLQAALREPAQSTTHASRYSRKNVVGRRCA
jgi:hypothetical protein